MDEQQLVERFNAQWIVWIEEMRTVDVNVKHDVLKCLDELSECLKPSSPLAISKLIRDCLKRSGDRV